MKAFSTTRLGFFSLALMAMPALTQTVSGSSPATLPHQQHWEEPAFSVNDSPIGMTGWYGNESAYATVTNLTYEWTLGRPLDHFTGDAPATTNQALWLDTENSSISNVLGGTAGNTNVVTDVMVQFVPSPDEDAHGIITNDSSVQVAYYLNTNEYVVLYHSVRDNMGFFATYSNAFTTVTNVLVETGTWARVTVTLNYLTHEPPFSDKYFQIAINGQLVTNDLAWSYPGINSPGGTWFVCANKFTATALKLGAVSFSGTGYIDDYRVSGDAATPWRIDVGVNDSRGGTYFAMDGTTPLDSTLFVRNNESTNFMLVTSQYWRLADEDPILTNGVALASPNPLTNEFTYSNVSMDHTVDATFVAYTTSVFGGPDVPDWWIAHYFPDSNATDFAWIATNSVDGDALLTWQEWLAGTDPADSNSVFRIAEFYPYGAGWRLRWQSHDLVGSDLPPYLVQRSTNLVAAGDVWHTVGTNASRTAGQKDFTDNNAPTNVPVFYRLSVPNVF